MTLYNATCFPLDKETFIGSTRVTCVATIRDQFLLSGCALYLESVCIHTQIINLHKLKSIISLGQQQYIQVKGTC
jgi:hypothetical protein